MLHYYKMKSSNNVLFTNVQSFKQKLNTMHQQLEPILDDYAQAYLIYNI